MTAQITGGHIFGNLSKLIIISVFNYFVKNEFIYRIIKKQNNFMKVSYDTERK